MKNLMPSYLFLRQYVRNPMYRSSLLLAFVFFGGCMTGQVDRVAAINSGIANSEVKAGPQWDRHSGYLHELERTIEQQWYRILEESRISPPRGSHAVITFKINSKGETDIINVEDVGCGKQGVWFCVHAIQDKQPYRKWDDQMTVELGDEQTLVFAFYYQ